MDIFVCRHFNGAYKDSDEADFYKFLFTNSSFFNLDEVELATLFTVSTLENYENLTDDSKKQLHELIKQINMSEAFASANAVLLDRPPRQIIETELLKIKATLLPEIRGKLAFLEVFASCLIPEAIAQIVTTCPKYFGEALIQKWLLMRQWEYRYSENETIVEEAKRQLDLVFSAFKGDRRKVKSRIYQYWRCNFRYESLIRLINTLRSKDMPKDLNNFGLVAEYFNIPKEFGFRAMNATTAPAELALEIMVFQRDISNPKAFRDFQSHVSKLRDRHPEATANPFIQYFLDYQHSYLESFNKTDIWSVLENL